MALEDVCWQAATASAAATETTNVNACRRDEGADALLRIFCSIPAFILLKRPTGGDPPAALQYHLQFGRKDTNRLGGHIDRFAVFRSCIAP